MYSPERSLGSERLTITTTPDGGDAHAALQARIQQARQRLRTAQVSLMSSLTNDITGPGARSSPFANDSAMSSARSEPLVELRDGAAGADPTDRANLTASRLMAGMDGAAEALSGDAVADALADARADAWIIA